MHINTTIALLFIALFVTSAAAFADDRMDKVKAVFMYKFLDYVQWPPAIAPSSQTKATLCTYGETPIVSFLEQLSSHPTKAGQSEIRPIENAEDLEGCHMIFATAPKADALIAAVQSSSILTLSDKDGFAEAGGMIELKEAPQKLQLIINLQTAQKAQLKLRSGLLKIATVIR